MKREPSIHITETQFRRVIRKILVVTNSELEEIFINCSKYQLTTRKLNLTNERVEKKAKMLISSDKGDAQVFANLLFHVRKQLKHRGITAIKEGTRDWLILKEVCKLANEFCESFRLDKRDGYIEFIKIALSKMNKFSINKVQSMCAGISDAYAAKIEISQDEYPEITNRGYQRYNSKVLDRTGLTFNYKEQPEKYVFFIRVAQICIEMGITPENYIDSQLESFVFKDSIPDPAQLVGVKAKDRAVKYMFDSGKKIKQEVESKVNFKAIKNVKNSS